MNDSLLVEMIKKHEGFSAKPYQDIVGKTTIGWGRNLSDIGISKNEALILLENDISAVFSDLDRMLPWWRSMTENRWDGKK